MLKFISYNIKFPAQKLTKLETITDDYFYFYHFFSAQMQFIIKGSLLIIINTDKFWW